MSVRRRTLIAPTLAVSVGQGPVRVPGDAAPVTILQLRRRTIEVNGKSASVFGIRRPSGTARLTTKVGSTFRVGLADWIASSRLSISYQRTGSSATSHQ